jgi:hypothetical protein
MEIRLKKIFEQYYLIVLYFQVRWANGNIGKYKYGKDGAMELKVVP